jgi:hypothetical protein
MTCAAPECPYQRTLGLPFCLRHWKALPGLHRARIAAAWASGGDNGAAKRMLEFSIRRLIADGYAKVSPLKTGE